MIMIVIMWNTGLHTAAASEPETGATFIIRVLSSAGDLHGVTGFSFTYTDIYGHTKTYDSSDIVRQLDSQHNVFTIYDVMKGSYVSIDSVSLRDGFFNDSQVKIGNLYFGDPNSTEVMYEDLEEIMPGVYGQKDVNGKPVPLYTLKVDNYEVIHIHGGNWKQQDDNKHDMRNIFIFSVIGIVILLILLLRSKSHGHESRGQVP